MLRRFQNCYVRNLPELHCRKNRHRVPCHLQQELAELTSNRTDVSVQSMKSALLLYHLPFKEDETEEQAERRRKKARNKDDADWPTMFQYWATNLQRQGLDTQRRDE